MELISFSFKDFLIIFNLHNASVPIPNEQDEIFKKEYKENFNQSYPDKNWNEYNLFAVRNDEIKGTEEIEKLDKYEMYNNCEG